MVPTPSIRDRTWPLVVGWALTALTIHVVGNRIGLYSQYMWFQVLTHFCSSTALAALLAKAGWEAGLRGGALYAAIVSLTVGGAIGWELIEYFDVFENLHFHGLGDALLDMTTNLVGLGVVLGVVWNVTTEAPTATGRDGSLRNEPE